jgi:benzoyl-CoA reductase/2-hydroxyglutaryl-CoA dehydratase subunit BcrC/BadD/HgdB
MERVMAWRLRRRPNARDRLLHEVARLGLEAFQGERPVVWATVYALPIEILTTFGFIPLCHEYVAATFASVGKGTEVLKEAEERGFSRDSCSFQRGGLGAGLADYLPRPVAMVGTTNICDGVAKVYETMGRCYGLEPILLQPPYGDGPREVEYLEGQLKGLIGRLEEATGQKFDEGRLEEVVHNANEMRALMLRVNELRKAIPSPWHGREAFEFTFLAYLMWGTERLIEIYRELIAELEARIGEPTDGERLRILWLHAMPYHRTNLFDLFEERGARVVCDELSMVYWEPTDERMPLRSMAERMLCHPSHGSIMTRARLACRLAQEYQVDGALHFNHWGCRQGCGGVRVIKDALAEVGVPMLSLDGDGTDDRNYAPGQEKTRVEAFLEMVG